MEFTLYFLFPIFSQACKTVYIQCIRIVVLSRMHNVQASIKLVFTSGPQKITQTPEYATKH